jgi:hypothetical protein
LTEPATYSNGWCSLDRRLSCARSLDDMGSFVERREGFDQVVPGKILVVSVCPHRFCHRLQLLDVREEEADVLWRVVNTVPHDVERAGIAPPNLLQSLGGHQNPPQAMSLSCRLKFSIFFRNSSRSLTTASYRSEPSPPEGRRCSSRTNSRSSRIAAAVHRCCEIHDRTEGMCPCRRSSLRLWLRRCGGEHGKACMPREMILA